MPHGQHDLEQAFKETFEREGISLPRDLREALARGLVKAVEAATTRAVETVSTIDRRKVVRATALLTAIVVAAISIPVTYVITKENADQIRASARKSAHAEALRSCEAGARVRPQSNARAFSQLAIYTLLNDAVTAPKQTPEGRAFAAAELRTLNFRAEGKGPKGHRDKRLPDWRHEYTKLPHGNVLPSRITSFGQLAETIHPLALIDCRAILAG